MLFKDFYVGQVLTAGPILVEKHQALAFAYKYDPQWFHADEARARGRPFSGLIISGFQTCALAMRLVVDNFLADSESFASPGINHVKWSHSVRPEDTLSLDLTIFDTRHSASRPTTGIVRWRWQLQNQDDIEVLDLDARVSLI